MSKKVLVDKYGNEFVKIEVKYNNKAQSIVMNDWRIGGCKWNDVDNGKFLTLLVNKKDLINELGIKKQIADLEAKLAESENKVKGFVELFDKKQHENYEQFCEIQQLKQQLAEKEKEIVELKQRLKDTIKIYSDDFVEKDKELKELRFQARNIFPLVENLEDKVNQDKISFCIEQLDKVKINLCELFENEHGCCVICSTLDNQIEELKKEMK